MKKQYFLIAIGAITMNTLSAQTAMETRTQESIANQVVGLSSSGAGSAMLYSFAKKEDTRGTRYLFENWVNGVVVTSDNRTIQKDNLLFNYDKITQNLYLTTDRKEVIEIDKDKIQSFTLRGDAGNQYSYEKIGLINTTDFFQFIAGASGKYLLYKCSKTKFQKADYHTDGMVETGKNYDEYVETNDYYVLFPGGMSYKQIDLKKKAIRDALSAESAKVNAYFSGHKYDAIDENFLKGLVLVLNQ